MTKNILMALSCLALIGVATRTDAAVVATLDSQASVGGNTPTDNGLVTQISSSDKLNGITPSLSAGLSVGTASSYSDGTGGEQDFNPDGRAFFSDGTSETVTFSGLTAFNLGEVRVYTYNTDDRAVQNFTLVIDTGSGFGAPIITVAGGTGGGGGVSRIYDDTNAFIATGVVGLRFTMSNNSSNLQQATVEIDAFDVSPIPAPTALPAGLALLTMTVIRRRRV